VRQRRPNTPLSHSTAGADGNDYARESPLWDELVGNLTESHLALVRTDHRSSARAREGCIGSRSGHGGYSPGTWLTV
jgi:hypothetical protein